jgi:membrane-associated phospholipid phosphatase
VVRAVTRLVGLALAVLLLAPGGAAAQSPRTANVLSNVTVAASLGIQAVDAWRAENRSRALVMTGARIGATAGVSWILKTIIHRDRPCAPSCGREDPHASFPSGHTALAFSASARHVLITWSLGGATAAGRVEARKHHVADTLAGALVGAAAARWIR